MRFYPLPTGDGEYKPYVSSDPDVTTVDMNGTEDFLVIACDGLWDVVSPMAATATVFKQIQSNKGRNTTETRGRAPVQRVPARLFLNRFQMTTEG